MKIVTIIVSLLLLVTFISAAENSLTINFTTGSYGGWYAPRHCLAVWITDESGNYIKSVQINGRVPRYRNMLASWIEASDWDSTDAVTSASINAHRSHTSTWDLTDVDGNKIPKGAYKVWIEQTEDNSSFPGFVPLAELDVQIGDQSAALSFDDVIFESKKSIYDISMSLLIDGSPITKIVNNKKVVQKLQLSGNTLSLRNKQSGEYAVQILNARGQEVATGKTEQGIFTLGTLAKGVYYARFTQGTKTVSESFQY